MDQAAEYFVGRQRETGVLQAAFASARDGYGRLVVIAGEPGIGKTRIAAELAHHAAGQQARAVWGRCLEEAGAPPYWPWVQILRAVAATLTDAELRADLATGAPEVAGIVADIAERLPGLAPSPPLSDPSEGRFRLFSAIAHFLAAISRRQPLVLIFDDLHWADVPSLRLLEFLAQEIAESRLLVVGTYRETELSRRHRLTDTLGALGRVPHFQRLHLSGLDAEDVRRFVGAAAGIVPPPALTNAIHDQTEGNPLFLREVVRLLVDQRQLGGDISTVAVQLPEGVREVIGRRLNLLSAACNETLAIASVIGRAFPLAVLLRACHPRAEASVLEALDEAMAAHIVEATGADAYQFTHALVRLTLFDELRIGQRRRLHHVVGEAIEAVHRRDPDAVAADLAYHFRASGLGEDAGRAIDYAIRAAQRADRALAYEDAISLCQNALDLLDTLGADDPDRRCALMLMLGDAQRKASDFPGALATLRTALDIARAEALPLRFGELALAYGYTFYRNHIFADIGAVEAVVEPILQEASRTIPESALSLRIRVVALQARVRGAIGAFDDARELASKAVTMARAHGDPAVLVASLYTLILHWLYEPHEIGQVLPVLIEMTELAAGTGEMEHATPGYTRLAALYLELGRLAPTMAALDKCHSSGIFNYVKLSWTASLALMRGELDTVESILLQITREGGMGAGSNDPVAVLIFALRREQGRLRELGPLVSLFMRQTETAATWRPGLALLWLELGERDAARKIFAEIAARDFVDLPRDARWLTSLSYLAEVCVALGDTARAAQLYRLMLPWADLAIVLGTGTGCWGSTDRFLGMLATTMGDWDAADRHFKAAIAMNAQIEAWLYLAHTRCDYAAMLLARGDRTTAALQLDQAAEAADTMGLPAVAARVTLLRTQPVTPGPAPAAPDHLTTRELEVLQLLAIGRSNADTAMVLDISLNTVATHVRNILAKTGCANRTEAGAYAVRHRLTAPSADPH